MRSSSGTAVNRQKAGYSMAYSAQTLKLLWGRSGNRCAYPSCGKTLTRRETENDTDKVVSIIAHIVSRSDTGPRADPDMPMRERDEYPNLILLCGYHHDVVDAQHATFTVKQITQWKQDHENWVENQLRLAQSSVDFQELEEVTEALLGPPGDPTDRFHPLAPEEKLAYNDLSASSKSQLDVGYLRCAEVADYVRQRQQRDSGFPERLVGGFRSEYDRLFNADFRGDTLFVAMVDFATHGHTSFVKQAAGVAVLVYLFDLCEVFESP